MLRVMRSQPLRVGRGRRGAGVAAPAGAVLAVAPAARRIQCEHIYKWFDKALILEDVSLQIEDHQFVCMVGPSGCGKTTLLRMIAGLAERDHGEITVAGQPVTEPRRQVAVVFQHFGLFPWKNVFKNVALPLEAAGMPKAEVRRRVEEAIALVGLEHVEDRYPAQLSGGMRQRVGLARALALEPDVLLMDEPFASVDAQVREILQEELLGIWSRLRQTVLFITHSIDEAITLADRIVVLGARPGRVVRDLTVPIDRPRSVAGVRRHPSYTELREEIWDELRRAGLGREAEAE